MIVESIGRVDLISHELTIVVVFLDLLMVDLIPTN